MSRDRASDTFDSSSCKDCQDNCCRKFFIILEDIRDWDWMKWLSFHEGVSIEKLGGTRIKVWFNYLCTYLRDDNSCGIYKKRPRMCRKFSCEKLDAALTKTKTKGWFG